MKDKNKKYIAISFVLLLLLMVFFLYTPESEDVYEELTIYDCSTDTGARLRGVANDEYCVVEFTVPENIHKIKSAYVLIDIASTNTDYTFTFTSGIAKTPSFDQNTWLYKQDIDYTSFLGGHHLIQDASIPVTPGDTYYLIWCHSKDNGNLYFDYRLTSDCPLISYRGTEQIEDNFFIKIDGYGVAQ
jgi:hypothetical protein